MIKPYMYFDWTQLYDVMLFAGSIGIVVGLIRAYLDETYTKTLHNTTRVTRITLASFLVAELVSLGIHEFSIGITGKVSITIVCAYVATDLLLGIRSMGKLVANNPLELAHSIKELLGGGRRYHYPQEEIPQRVQTTPSTPNQKVEP